MKPLSERLSSERLKDIATKVVEDIDAGVRAYSSLKDRWAKNESFYRGDPLPQTNFPFENAANIHMPLVQPKVDGLTDNVCEVIAGNNPYFAGKMVGPQGERVPKHEKAMQFFWELACFEQRTRLMSPITANCGVGMWRLQYVEQEADFLADQPDALLNQLTGSAYAGLVLDVIHPADCVVFPATQAGILGAKTVGHRFYRRLREIRELGQVGRYIAKQTEYVKGGDDPSTREAGFDTAASRTTNDSTSEPLDDQVECWEVITKLVLPEDKTPGEKAQREKYYLVTVAKSDVCILRIERYKLPRPWYFKSFYHEEYGQYYPAGSFSQNMQGLQIENNANWSTYQNGAYMAATPPVYVPSTGLTQKKIQQYAPGDQIPVDSAFSPYAIPVTFDGTPFIEAANKFEELAEIVTGISRNGLGSVMPGGKTATEAEIIRGGQSTRINGYIANFSVALAEMANFAPLLLAMNFGVPEYDEETGEQVYRTGWKRIYGDAVPVDDPQEFLQPIRYEVAGKTPLNTPRARKEQAMAFVGAAVETPIGEEVNWRVLGEALAAETQIPNNDAILLTEEQKQQRMASAVPEDDIKPTWEDLPPSVQAQKLQRLGYQVDETELILMAAEKAIEKEQQVIAKSGATNGKPKGDKKSEAKPVAGAVQGPQVSGIGALLGGGS